MEFKDYIKENGLPFKIFKENGTEVVILELEDESELIDKLELGFKMAEKVCWISRVYGIDIEITKDLTLEALEEFEEKINEVYERG